MRKMKKIALVTFIVGFVSTIVFTSCDGTICVQCEDPEEVDAQGFICKTKADYTDKVFMVKMKDYVFDDFAKAGVLIPLVEGYYYNYETPINVYFSRLTQEEYEKGVSNPQSDYLLDNDPFTEIWVSKTGNKGFSDSLIAHYNELILNNNLNQEFKKRK